MSTVKSVKNKIRKALRDQQNYSKSMEMAIELAAANYIVFEIAILEIEGLDSTYVSEISREGAERLMPHPVFKVFKDASETLRKSLRELQLTLQTLQGTTEDDELNKLIDRVENVK